MAADDLALTDLVERVAALERQVARLTTGGASIATGALPIGMVPRSEAAKFLGMKVTTLNRWSNRGSGPPFILWRNRAYYCRVELEAWAAEKMQSAKRGERGARADRKGGAPLLAGLL